MHIHVEVGSCPPLVSPTIFCVIEGVVPRIGKEILSHGEVSDERGRNKECKLILVADVCAAMLCQLFNSRQIVIQGFHADLLFCYGLGR